MKISTFIIIAIFTVSMGALAQSKARAKRILNFTYEVQCLGADMGGMYTVKAFGRGNSRKDAIEDGFKQALYAVIFKGVTLGKPGCDARPLVNVPNAEETYEEYFNNFFKDGGEYKMYLTEDDTPNKDTKKEKKGSEDVYSVIATIKVSELKKALINKGIIPKPE
ncbi:MAG: hypothetical protein NW207_04495 [Cytophagales bacterium]|nr:hypothetical protein [Cytophagales bacterium]